MFLRIDKLPVELPQSPEIDPITAKNVQELVGGRFGEMSTLMNYTFQSFNDARTRHHQSLLRADFQHRC
jgi:Mn-containing catalase